MQQTSEPSLTLGAFLIGIAIFFICFGMQISTSAFTTDGDPGPRAIPVLLGTSVLLGGLWEILSAIRLRFRQGNRNPKTLGRTEVETLRKSFPDDAEPTVRRVVWFCVLLLIYVLAVPWAFYVSTFAFTVAGVRYLGAKWMTALGLALGVTSIVWLLFVRLFKLSLPTVVELWQRIAAF